MTANTKKARSNSEMGYVSVRISKKAHKELVLRAVTEKRTLVAQLDSMLGV